ncbi:MAG TPA: pitrilysin family protein [Gemmataceae bacterium]
MSFHHTTLPNGLQIIGEVTPTMRSVALGFFVQTGARDETPEVSGVSHFLEHMAFKGTPRRSARQVNLDFDRIGASPNAYTSEEHTVFHSHVLPEYVPQAIDILADILRPSLRQEDFDTEKKVIIDEIARYEDQPMWAAFDQARKLYYADHPLGNSILGSVQSITELTREQMHAYFRRRYVAPNIVMAAAGNFDWDRLVGLVGERCGGWEEGPAGRGDRREARGTGGEHVLRKEGVAQEYVLAIGPGPAADSPLRYAADVLSMAVGDETGSRLYWELIDPGLADSAGCEFSEYDANGVFFTYFNGAPERAAENLGVVRRVLEQVQREGVTAAELEQAKSKLTARLVRAGERPMSRMRAIAGAWTYTGEYRDLDTELANYDAVTPGAVRELLERYPMTHTTVVAYGPLAEVR